MQSFVFGSKFYKEYTAHDANQFHIRNWWSISPFQFCLDPDLSYFYL